MNDKTRNRPFSVVFPREIKSTLARVAAQKKITRSALVRTFVERGLRYQDEAKLNLSSGLLIHVLDYLHIMILMVFDHLNPADRESMGFAERKELLDSYEHRAQAMTRDTLDKVES